MPGTGYSSLFGIYFTDFFKSFFFFASNLKNGMYYDHAIKLASNLNRYNFDP